MSVVADLLGSERGEPALHLIKPGHRGWREVFLKSRVAGILSLDGLGPEYALVAHPNMDVQILARWCYRLCIFFPTVDEKSIVAKNPLCD